MTHYFVIAIILNIAISFLLAAGMAVLITPKYKKQSYVGVLLLLFALFVFVPILGVACVWLTMLIITLFVKEKEDIVAEHAHYPDFLRDSAIKTTNFGEGGAQLRLHSPNFKLKDKVQSLVAVNVNASGTSNQINRDMLRSDSDELRLYAFSILDKQEKGIYSKIKHEMDMLDSEEALVEDRAEIYKNIAWLYWELVFFRLVSEDLIRFSLKKAFDYARMALQHLKSDFTMWILMGRIFLHKKQYTQAMQAFERALSMDAPVSKVAPYLAELAFYRRDFDSVKYYFSVDNVLRDIPRMHSVVNFWKRYG